MNRKMEAIINLASFVLVTSAVIMWLITFTTAYVNPDKTIMVDINSVGEAKIEMFAIAIPTFLALLFLIRYYWKDVLRNLYVSK
ncbi:MAG: hypothetical protein QXO27_03465 [Candidatus Aenigmatarchaeota archaeon]